MIATENTKVTAQSSLTSLTLLTLLTSLTYFHGRRKFGRKIKLVLTFEIIYANIIPGAIQ
jgi:hypothetical protein